MATGRLGAADLAAGTLTTVYTVPASTYGVVTCSLCNRGNSAISVRMAVAVNDTPTNGEYIEYDVNVRIILMSPLVSIRPENACN